MNFYPIKTSDDTISLYNFDVNDVYHSKVGAYTESLHKYTLPSGLLDYIRNNKEITILDVCYGLGYNSRTAAEEIFKINPEIKINITALEIDPEVLAFSCLVGDKIYTDEINYQFFINLEKVINVSLVLENFIKNTHARMPYIESYMPGGYELITLDEINAKLHNIYYRSISSRNIGSDKYAQNLSITYLIQDARVSLQELVAQNAQFDYIFHDPFTPSKVPMLWTVEVFKLLHKLLSANGNLTTYTSAAPVRAGMLEAGFFIGQTIPVGKKTSGTFACKQKDFIKYPLSEKESGLLVTNAGIPYRDNSFAAGNDSIITARTAEQTASGRMSSSRYLKDHKLQ